MENQAVKFVSNNSCLHRPAQALTDIPLVLTIDGSRYILCSNSKIRQSHHRMRRDESGYDVVVETILEPEEGQHITTCKVLIYKKYRCMC